MSCFIIPAEEQEVSLVLVIQPFLRAIWHFLQLQQRSSAQTEKSEVTCVALIWFRWNCKVGGRPVSKYPLSNADLRTTVQCKPLPCYPEPPVSQYSSLVHHGASCLHQHDHIHVKPCLFSGICLLKPQHNFFNESFLELSVSTQGT